MLAFQLHRLKESKHKELLFVCLLFFMFQISLQLLTGSFTSEFGESTDEAGHYVTGLMVRDYIASGNLSSPMKFAENFYVHYPKVAFGHWPPLFYIVQALWTLPFSESRISLLILMALIITTLSGSLYIVIKEEFGIKKGILVGLLLIALPLIQEYSGMIMAEALITLLSFWAALFFGRFLEKERWQDAINFSIFAVLAIFTKGNGMALALLPPIALLFSRRFYLLIRPSFWIMPAIVLIFCSPFYWQTLDMVVNGWSQNAPTLRFTNLAIRYYSYELIKIVGIGLSIFVAIGFANKVIQPFRHKRTNGKWAAIGALPLSVLLFQCIVPSGLAARHLIVAAPALLMFLVAGVAWTADKLPLGRLSVKRKVAVLSLSIVLVFAVETFTIHKKAWYGFGTIAQRLLSTTDFQNSVFLVSSDARGEGMFISEIAMREHRPGHIVLRASKLLSTSRWDGSEYSLLYPTPEKIMNYLERMPVGVVIVDKSIPLSHEREHHRLLSKAIEAYSHRWRLLGSYPLTRRGTVYHNAVYIYSLIGYENQSVDTIRINMDKMLGRDLEKTFER
jgi:hypothetical protein